MLECLQVARIPSGSELTHLNVPAIFKHQCVCSSDEVPQKSSRHLFMSFLEGAQKLRPPAAETFCQAGGRSFQSGGSQSGASVAVMLHLEFR